MTIHFELSNLHPLTIKNSKPLKQKSEEPKSRKQKTQKQKLTIPSAGEFIEPASAGKHNNGDLSITKNWQFLGLLHQPISAFWKCNLSAVDILNLLDLNSASSHGGFGFGSGFGFGFGFSLWFSRILARIFFAPKHESNWIWEKGELLKKERHCCWNLKMDLGIWVFSFFYEHER